MYSELTITTQPPTPNPLSPSHTPQIKNSYMHAYHKTLWKQCYLRFCSPSSYNYRKHSFV